MKDDKTRHLMTGLYTVSNTQKHPPETVHHKILNFMVYKIFSIVFRGSIWRTIKLLKDLGSVHIERVTLRLRLRVTRRRRRKVTHSI